VLGKDVSLGEQLFPLPFYLCEGRRGGPGYTRSQGSFHYWPR
jgi:hypothetical protein